MYTIIGSANNGLDPELYLRTVLEYIADHPNQPHTGSALEHGSLTLDPLFSGRLRHTHQMSMNKK